MGTRRSKHNQGRKPMYKEHRRNIQGTDRDLSAAHEGDRPEPKNATRSPARIRRTSAITQPAPSVAAPPPIEVVSLPALLDRPRFFNGFYLNSRLHWSRPDNVALKALTAAAADLEKSAAGLGRTPKILCNRARDTGLTLPDEWLECLYPGRTERRAARQRRKDEKERELARLRRWREPVIHIEYPYIREVRGEHADLLAINALVPAGIPHHLRADVCQELMLAVLEGKTSIANLKDDLALRKRLIRYYSQQNTMVTSYALSLDAPLGDDGSWYDILPAPKVDDGDVLHSFEELAAAFPSVVRSGGGKQVDEHERPRKRPDRCPHGLFVWNRCDRCDTQYAKSLLAREESGRYYE